MNQSGSDDLLRRHEVFGYKISDVTGMRLPTRVWLNNRIRNLQDEIAMRNKQLQEHLRLAEPTPLEIAKYLEKSK